MARGQIRVVVADDSRLMRSMLSKGLEKSGFDVVGTAVDGDEALRLCRDLRPDVLTLDLAMPGTDGMAVLRALREGGSNVPVVVVSAFSAAHGARAVDALAEGAVELAAKPAAGESFDHFLSELVSKVEAAAASAGPSASRRRSSAEPAAPAKPSGGARRSSTKKAVVIAVSTGGPKALAQLMPQLPARLGEGVLIVQHMPPGFTSSLAERLDKSSRITVREAKEGDRLEPGVALLAPGGSHVRIESVPDCWQAKPELRRHLRFDVGDLLVDRFPVGGYDLILCRNVVISSAEDVRNELHRRLSEALRPGGDLVVGATERVASTSDLGLTSAFPFTFRKA